MKGGCDGGGGGGARRRSRRVASAASAASAVAKESCLEAKKKEKKERDVPATMSGAVSGGSNMCLVSGKSGRGKKAAQPPSPADAEEVSSSAGGWRSKRRFAASDPSSVSTVTELTASSDAPIAPKPPPPADSDGPAAATAPSDPALVTQSPRTLRLLRLVSSGSSAHASAAVPVLDAVASRLSPPALWDLLGRLQRLLSSRRWDARVNAARAMERVGRHLPRVDRTDFLGERGDGWRGAGPGGKKADGGGDRDEDENLWLSVDDLIDGEGVEITGNSGGDCGGGKMDAVLRNGRILLASSGEQYDMFSGDDDDDELVREGRMLSILDASAREHSVVSAAGADWGEEGGDTFLERRVRLQRRILARRLGLGGILSMALVTASAGGGVEGMIGEEDLLPAEVESRTFGTEEDKDAAGKCRGGGRKRKGGGKGKGRAKCGGGNGKRRRRRKKKKNFADDFDGSTSSDEEEEEAPGAATLRALLVLEMRRTSVSSSVASGSVYGPSPSDAASSHRNPQTLLTTDLLYRTFDPRWHVRHGALLGILALLRAWKMHELRGDEGGSGVEGKGGGGSGSCSASLRLKSEEADDTMVGNSGDGDSDGNRRLIGDGSCFGRWPHDILARCLCVLALDRFGDFSGSAISSAGAHNANADADVAGMGSGVVAPVRETAAQLLSLLLTAAPDWVRGRSLQVLSRLARYQSEDGWTGWEVRHGAMLGMKYVAALLPMAPEGDGMDIAALAVTRLSDQSDDVRGAAGGVLSCILCAADGDGGGLTAPSSDTSRGECRGANATDCVAAASRIVRSASSPVWSALLSVDVVSSCSIDLLRLLGDLVARDCDGVMDCIGAISPHTNAGESVSSFKLIGPGLDVDAAMGETSTTSDLTALSFSGRDSSRIASLECMIRKLLNFLVFQSPSVRMSCLRVVSHIAVPVAHAAKTGAREKGKDRGSTSLSGLASAYCRLLEHLFSSHFDDVGPAAFVHASDHCAEDDPGAAEGEDATERWRAERFDQVRGGAWSKAVESLSILWTAERQICDKRVGDHIQGNESFEDPFCLPPDLSLLCGRLVMNTIVSLLLRLVGIERALEDGTSALASVVPLRRIHLSPIGLEGKLCSNFEAQLRAADALAGLCSRVGLLTTQRTSEDNSTTTANIADHTMTFALEDTIEALLGSPWPEICEGGCILYNALAQRYPNDSCSDRAKKLSGCYKQLVAMLGGDSPCIRARPTVAARTARVDPRVATVCDSALASFAADRILSAAPRSVVVSASSTRSVLELWKAAFRSVGVDWKNGGLDPEHMPAIAPLGGRAEPTTTSMRLGASAAGAIVSSGMLPAKLTPLIQALMTSLRNELSNERANFACRSLARLISLLSGGANSTCLGSIGAGEAGPRQTVKDRLLDNIADLACAEVHDDRLLTMTSTKTACSSALRLLAMVFSSDQSRMFSLRDMMPLWSRLCPLFTMNESGNGDVVQLGSALKLLRSIVPGLSASSRSYSDVVDRFLANVAFVACDEGSQPRWQSDALSSTIDICRIDPLRAMPIALPVLLRCIRSLDSDNLRIGACRLLHALIDSLQTEICPFVRCLLPVAMTMMADLTQECSRMAASSFALLVRAAPLVSERGDSSPIELLPDNSNRSADGVIDHLIHGQPLPPCHLPEEVGKALTLSRVKLREYQTEGVSWICFLRGVGLNGALCDDMGLGKTLQALVGIAIAHYEKREYNQQSQVSLVVCPSTVVGHWQNEIVKYFSAGECFRILSYTGSAKKRIALWKSKSSESNIVITSYSVLRNDIELLAGKVWLYCVLDEGHLLKNPKTATARAARRLKCRHKLILTGTPVQNRVNELWASFDFLMPNFLGTQSMFTKEYAKPILTGQLPGATAERISVGMNKLRILHQQVLPFILRREKVQVMKELPPKIVTEIPCALSSEQLDLYEKCCERLEAKDAFEKLERTLKDPDGSSPEEQETWGQKVLKSLCYLRLLCTHPALVVWKGHQCDADGASHGQVLNPHDFKSQPSFTSLGCSGKLVALNDLLRSSGIYHEEMTGADNDDSLLYLDSGIGDDEGELSLQTESGISCGGEEEEVTESMRHSKCLIFAQFSRSLDIVEQFLFRPHMPSLRYLRLDGQVSPKDRIKTVERFNSDGSVKALLLTTKVGGLGLNLTGADTVIFLEHDWNPHVDIQAMDRAHRIGQTKTVNVYRLVMSGTIEERVMKMQQAKLAVSRAIVNTENSTLFSMGTDRLLDLFTPEDACMDRCEKTVKVDSNSDSCHEEEYSSLSVQEFLRMLRDAQK